MTSTNRERKLASAVIADAAAGRGGPGDLTELMREWAARGITVGVLESGPVALLFTAALIGYPAAGLIAGGALWGLAGAVAGVAVAFAVLSPAMAALFTDSPRLNLAVVLALSAPVTGIAGMAAAWWCVLAGPRRADAYISAAQARAAGVSPWWPRPVPLGDSHRWADTATDCLAGLVDVLSDAADWLSADSEGVTQPARSTMEACAADLRAARRDVTLRAAGDMAGLLSSVFPRPRAADGSGDRAAVAGGRGGRDVPGA